jgi:hypothetical protein
MNKKVKKVNWIDKDKPFPSFSIPSINSLGQLEVTEVTPDVCYGVAPWKQQESNMQVAVNTQEDTARDHLMQRLHQLRWTKEEELGQKFHVSRKSPKNVKEAKDWLISGYYRFDDKSDDETYWRDYFRWGTEDPDKEGFYAAMTKMKAAKQEAEDIVMVKTDEDARLKALKDFETATFH